jgi:hypothetical protein
VYEIKYVRYYYKVNEERYSGVSGEEPRCMRRGTKIYEERCQGV